MKKFNLTVFYNGDIYNARSICEIVSIDVFTSLFDTICSANNIPKDKAEILWFDFDFIDVSFDDPISDLLEESAFGDGDM